MVRTILQYLTSRIDLGLTHDGGQEAFLTDTPDSRPSRNSESQWPSMRSAQNDFVPMSEYITLAHIRQLAFAFTALGKVPQQCGAVLPQFTVRQTTEDKALIDVTPLQGDGVRGAIGRIIL